MASVRCGCDRASLSAGGALRASDRRLLQIGLAATELEVEMLTLQMTFIQTHRESAAETPTRDPSSRAPNKRRQELSARRRWPLSARLPRVAPERPARGWSGGEERIAQLASSVEASERVGRRVGRKEPRPATNIQWDACCIRKEQQEV